jgi:hypothetical protein
MYFSRRLHPVLVCRVLKLHKLNNRRPQQMVLKLKIIYIYICIYIWILFSVLNIMYLMPEVRRYDIKM